MVPPALKGHFIAPIAFELPLERLPRIEVFGPVLHVCVYERRNLDQVLAWLRDTGYGLTLGIHSRIQSFVDQIVSEARVGNLYVNRSMIGAVVGVQPFGGEGLSGTGPKAGGPHYLFRFALERTLTVNTAAVGGVTELLAVPGRR
jgi:RHH-type proline utilization regulon transcriptional repressor/proline dehydrogenase/delta 1-pyrroline-5-carboxylate dehydrogenase